MAKRRKKRYAVIQVTEIDGSRAWSVYDHEAGGGGQAVGPSFSSKRDAEAAATKKNRGNMAKARRGKMKRRGGKRGKAKRRANQTPAQKKGACAAGVQAHGRSARRAKRECGATDRDQASFGRMGGRASGRARRRGRTRRRNPSGAMIALAALLALGGIAGGYGLYKARHKLRGMLPGGPAGPTQGAAGTMLGWEWLVDSNRIMVRPSGGDWTVIDQAGAKSVAEIEDLVSEYLRTVIWQPTSVMPPAIRLGNEAVALSLPSGWDEVLPPGWSAGPPTSEATSSNEGVATAEWTLWEEEDGTKNYRVLVTPTGVGTSIITVAASDLPMQQARVVVA